MAASYVEIENGSYRIAGTRVSLRSVVSAYLQGQSPEGIAESYPTLSMEQIFGALAFYLAHRDEVDAAIRREESAYDAARLASQSVNAELLERLRVARSRITLAE